MSLTERDARTLLLSLSTPTLARRQQVLGLGQDPAAVSAASKLLAEAPPDPVLWASLLVYLQGGAATAPLVKLAADKRTPVRVMACAGLLARGDARGFPALLSEIEKAGSGKEAAWAEAVWQLARWTGESSLGPPLDADQEQIAAAAARWSEWWKDSKDRLSFRDGRWSAA